MKRIKIPALLKILHPPTVESFRSEILSGYDIIHFDGYSGFGIRCPNCSGLSSVQEKVCGRCQYLLDGEIERDYLAFEREDGKLDSIASEELAEIVMSDRESPIKLVFLRLTELFNESKASPIKALLQGGIPAVLGISESLPTNTSIKFLMCFYTSLGAGMTFTQAFNNAFIATKHQDNESQLQKIPVLMGPGRDLIVLPAKAKGKASFEAERVYGLPEYEFVGDYIQADPPRGRKGLLSIVMKALQSGEKLVVLTGPGGIGKSVLAAEAARRLAWRYPGGVFWRSAADMERLDLDEMLNAFDNVFGLQFRTLPLDHKRDAVLNYIRNYDTASLLAVDSADSIKDEGLWRFLEGIPQPSAALVTTRESLPRDGKEIRIPEMETGEAGRLLLQEARRRSPHWGEHLSPEDEESLNEIARIMIGHPLAIKLIAALLNRRSLSSIRDELKKNPPREVSERFDISYKSLSKGQRDLFCRLAVFSGSVTEAAVSSICIEDADSDWQNYLGELERRSFLDRIEIATLDESGSEAKMNRYKLHPLMRQYAAGKAGEELLSRLRPKAAEFFLEYARYFANNFFMLSMEHENLLAAMDWFARKQESSFGEEKKTASHRILQLMHVLDSYLDTPVYWDEYDRRLRQTISAAEALEDRRQMAIWIHNLGILKQKRGDYDQARKLYQQSLEILKEFGDMSGVSKSLHQLGMLNQNIGDYDLARKYYQQSLEINQQLGDKSSLSKSLHQLGMLNQNIGDYDLARKYYQQSLEIFNEFGDMSGMSKSLHQLGLVNQNTGDYDQARKYYQQSLEINQQLGDRSSVSKSLYQLGLLAQITEDYEEARKLYQQSLEINQQLGDSRGIALTLAQLALLEEKVGNILAALNLIHKAETIFQDLRSPYAQLAEEVRQRLEQNQ